MRPRLPISLRRSNSVVAPAPTPMMQIRPPIASASRFSDRFGAPTSSRITSYSPCSTKASGSIAFTPSAAIWSRACWLRTVAVTRAPAITPSWTAAMPTPPAAPCTSNRSPTVRPAWVKSASWAVVKTSGTPPAAVQSSSSGTGIAVRSWTTASSAWPPPATIAITRSPGSKRPARRPQVTTSPASSSPGMSAGAPGGAG